MRKNIIYIALIFSLELLYSCSGNNILTPSSSGRPYEVLIVADKSYWNSSSISSLTDVLHSPIPALPQRENSFKVMYASPAHFDAVSRLVRCIIVARINSKYLSSRMQVAHNVYAQPQLILTIESPDENSFRSFVNHQSDLIVDELTRFEFKAQTDALQKEYNMRLSQMVDTIFGCEIKMPIELQYLKTSRNFLWASTETATADQNFVMYSYPIDTKEITKSYFIAKRDSVMKQNIPGYQRGVYMATDTAMMKIVKDNRKTVIRGLWKMNGDLMGGPFVSHYYCDKAYHRIVAVEVFVYSPDKWKGNLIRRLEASLYTLRLHSVSTEK